MPFSLRLQFSQEFEDIPTLGGESACALGILRIITKKMAVILQVRSATGSIRDNHVHLGTLEDVDGTARQIESRCFLTGVNQ